MVGVESHEVGFQCPNCGHDLKHIDTNRLANATEEIQKAIDKIPFRIKFFR